MKPWKINLALAFLAVIAGLQTVSFMQTNAIGIAHAQTTIQNVQICDTSAWPTVSCAGVDAATHGLKTKAQ